MEVFPPLQNLTLLPNKLYCNVYYHEYTDFQLAKGKTIPMWIYVTSGMNQVKQGELVLMLKLTKAELESNQEKQKIVPTAPLAFFKGMWTVASINSKVVSEGYIHTFGENGFIHKNIRGVIFVQHPDINTDKRSFSNTIPYGILKEEEVYYNIITIKDDELDICKATNPTRFLTLIGKQQKQFPFPSWSDLERDSVIPNYTLPPESIHVRAPHVKVPGVYTVYSEDDNKVSLQLPSFGTELLKLQLEKISLDSVVIFHSYYNEMQDGLFVWNPNQSPEVDRSDLEIFTKPRIQATTFGGSFFGFVPEQKEDETIIYEDGFLVMLTDSSWILLRKCLMRGSNCLVQSDTQKGIHAEIHFYQTEGDEELKKEDPTNPQVMILTLKEDLEKRTTAEDISTYKDNFTKSIPEYIKQNKDQLSGVKQLVLQFDISPGQKLQLKIATKPGSTLPTQVKKEIGDIVKKVPVLQVKGLVQFQIYFPVNANNSSDGGGGV